MQEKMQNVEEKGEDLLSHLLFTFVPYWPLFVILLFVCGASGWLYMKTKMPTYQATASIMLKDEKKGVDDAKILEALNISTTKNIVENEMEVLRSRTLMAQVVERLQLYAPVYKIGKFRSENLYGSSPLSIVARNSKKLDNSSQINFTYNAGKNTVTIDEHDYPASEWVQTPYGELKFSINNTTEAIEEPLYFMLSNSMEYADGLVDGLTIKPSNKMSTVLNLEFTDESPERAKDILKELIEDYERRTINEKNKLAANTLSFIEDRLSLLIRELDSIEQSIENYKSKEAIVNLSDEGKLFLNNVGDNDRKIGSINIQLAVLDQIERYVLSQDNRASMPSTVGLTDEVLMKLIQKLYDAQIQYEKQKQTVGENNPAVVAIASEIQNIRPTILQNIKNQKESLRASKADIGATNNQYTSLIRTIPGKERKLVEISREQSIKNGVYTYLLQKREETALSASSTVADSRLIDSSMALPAPVSPKPLDVFVGAFLLAILTGIFIVVAREYLPGKIMFRSDIEKFTKIPIAGEISSIRHRTELVIDKADKAYISEQFRHLRAALGLYGKVSKQKILVTSSIPGEGKSFVAANLALSLSLSGKKVVLIDADFRNPKSSSIYNMELETGFVEFLEDELTLTELIKKTAHNNLHIIPAGRPTINPTELLLSGKLHELFEFLSNHFDYIIVDSSPIAPVTDAYVLTDYCDKTLFVIRHGMTPKPMIRIIDENRKIKALKQLFIVFNGVKQRGFIKGKYGFGYGFGYEYVYKDRVKVRRRMKQK